MLLPIPADWQAEDGYVMALVCLPDSPTWRAIVRGKIQELCRGRVWDERTGNIKNVQVIGWEIYDSFMTCKLDDLTLAIQNSNDKIVFELARLNHNLDRIRDNLDSFAPDGNEETEYGLATILAALGPNVTKSTEFIKAIKDGLNSNLIGFPDESGDFAEGTTPAHVDTNGEITSFNASLNGESVSISIQCSGPTNVLIEMADKFQSVYIDAPGDVVILRPSDGWTVNYNGGEVRVIDQKFNIFTDGY